MNYTAGMFRFPAKAAKLREALTAAGIPSKLVTCALGSITLVMVKRHYGNRAVSINKSIFGKAAA
jgi:hypothetical protein